MGKARTVVLAWAFFILTGVFVAIVVPLGEGFDEPWHLGYIQYLSDTFRLPPGPNLPLSIELQYFLTHHPIGWRLHDIFKDLRTEDDYWHDSDAKRRDEDQALRELKFAPQYQAGPPGFRNQYESHQPPLYYAISVPLMIVASHLFSLPDTFFLIRLWSVLLASTVVPLSYLIVELVSESKRTAAAACMIVALFPGIYPDVVRVSNDALVVPLTAATLLAILLYIQSPHSKRSLIVLSACLVAGLSTKAIFIPVLLAIVIAFLYRDEYRNAGKVALYSAPGWIWYLRNAWHTGSLTGLPETVSANTTMYSSLSSVGIIDWFAAIKLAAVSHIWMGNWSLLQYRSWMYYVVLLFLAIGLAGFFAWMDKVRSPSAGILLFVYASFLASLVYYGTQVFQEAGIPVIQGWYLSPFIVLEAMAFVIGIKHMVHKKAVGWVVRFMGVCFLALIVYGNAFIAAPYYTGITAHVESGALQTYHPHWADVAIMSRRLVRLHPWMPAALPGALLLSMLALGFLTIWLAGDMGQPSNR